MTFLEEKKYRRLSVFNLFMLLSFGWEHGINKLFVMPFLARHFGEEKFGSFVLAMSVVLFFSAIIPAGVFMTNYREHARFGKKDRAELYDTILTILLVLCLFCAIVLFFSKDYIAVFFDNARVSDFIPFLVGYLVFLVAFNFGKQILIVDLRFGVRLCFDIIYGLLICMVVPIYFLVGENGVAAAYFLSALLAFLTLLGYLKRKRQIQKLRIVPQKLKLIWDSAPRFSVAAAILTLMTIADRWIVGVFRPENEVTYYYASVQIAALFGLPFGLLNTVLNAIFSKRKNLGEFRRAEVRLYSFALVFSVGAVALLGFLIGPVLIRVLYGEHILAAGRTAFYVLLVGQCFYLFRIFAQPLVPKFFSPTSIMRIQLACLAIFIALHLILVPQYGILGGAIATSVSFATLGLLHVKNVLLMARKEVMLHPSNRVRPEFTVAQN